MSRGSENTYNRGWNRMDMKKVKSYDPKEEHPGMIKVLDADGNITALIHPKTKIRYEVEK